VTAGAQTYRVEFPDGVFPNLVASELSVLGALPPEAGRRRGRPRHSQAPPPACSVWRIANGVYRVRNICNDVRALGQATTSADWAAGAGSESDGDAGAGAASHAA
jgi:hypothetical protein